MLNRKIFILPLLIIFSQLAVAAPNLIPAAPAINAKAYLLLDHQSGRILAQKNASQRAGRTETGPYHHPGPAR